MERSEVPSHLYLLASVGLLTGCFVFLVTGCTAKKNASAAEVQLPPGAERLLGQKVSADILDVLNVLARERITSENAAESHAAQFSNKLVRVNEAGAIQAYIYVDTLDQGTIATLKRLGIQIETQNENLHIVQGWVPFYQFVLLADLSFVVRVKPPVYSDR